MKKINSIAAFAWFFILGTFLFSVTASAYIDPSAMTYIVQIIVGIVIACSAAIALFFRKVKRKLRREAKPQDDHKEQEPVDFENDEEFDDSHLTDSEINDLNDKK